MEKEKIIAKNKEHLKKLITAEIKLNGIKCDLNHIEVKNVKDMSDLFMDSKFNGDISKWDVSNVKQMDNCFEKARISPWWNIDSYDERQSEINKRKLEGFFVFSSKVKKIKV